MGNIEKELGASISKMLSSREVIPTGMASFTLLALRYTTLVPEVKAALAKKNLKFRLILETPDFPPSALLEFRDGRVYISHASPELCADKSRWDGKLTANSEVLTDYFTGRLTAVRPLLFGKIKATRMLRLTKLLWFVKLTQKHLSGNRPFIYAVLHALKSVKLK
ncbi:MAG: hypothetical protein ACTSU5_14445 [Promethearchaeota archaeon]